MLNLPALRLVLILSASLPLAGCLQPVNAPSLGGGRTAAQLSDVSVGRIDGYLGYVLQSELTFLFGNGALVSNSRYQLNVKTSSGRATSIVDSFNSSVQSVSVQVEAVYQLKDNATGKLKGAGKTFASASYDRSGQRYATLRAQRDAEEKAAKLLAERLRIITIGLLRQGDSGAAASVPALNPAPDAAPAEPGETE